MLNVLLAVQDPESKELLSVLCQEKGCNAIVADSSFVVSENILDEDIDILFLDLALPGLNIENNMTAVREILRELPVIIIAEEPDLASEINVRKRNIFYFALKPLNPSEIEQVLQAAINIVTLGKQETTGAADKKAVNKTSRNRKVGRRQWLNNVITASGSTISVIPKIDRKISISVKRLIPNQLVNNVTAVSAYVGRVDNLLSNSLRKLLKNQIIESTIGRDINRVKKIL